MDKKTKMIVTGVVVLVIVILIFVAIRKRNNSSDDEDYSEDVAPEATSSGGTAAGAGKTAHSKPGYDYKFDAYKQVGPGSKGVNVKCIQKAINRYRGMMGVSLIAEDGVWGGQTTSAVKPLAGSPTTYAKVKEQVRYQFKRHGKGDPYATKPDVDILSINADHSWIYGK